MRAVSVLAGAVAMTSCAEADRQVDPLAAAPELERRERVRIGGRVERVEHALSGVVGAALLPSERIAIADASQQIRIFDLDGLHLRSVGGEGNGPGEFRAIRNLAVVSRDHLLVWDIQRRRVTVLDPGGAVTRSFLVDAGSLEAVSARFVGAFSDGGVALRSDLSPMGLREEPEGVRRDSIGIVLFDDSGAPSAPALRFAGPERDFYSSDRYWGFEEPLLARHLVHAIADRTLYVGHTDSIHLRRFVDGREIEPLEIRRPRRPASTAEIRAERELRVREMAWSIEAPASRLPAPDIQRALARYELARLQKVRALKTLPAFAELMSSDDGHLWLQDHTDYSTTTVSWHRLDDRGASLGSITLPISERLLSVTDRHMVTLVRDELDVESVIVYEIRVMER